MANRVQPNYRDTAKSVIQGGPPDRVTHREPREGRQVRSGGDEHPPREIAQVRPIVGNPRSGGGGPDGYLELARFQGQFMGYQRQQQDALEAEKAARRRLEEQVNRMYNERRRPSDSGGAGKGEIEDLKRRFIGLEATVLRMQQDIIHLKAVAERHSSDLMTINNEVKKRPEIEKSAQSSVQAMDGRMRDIHGQLMATRQALDNEMGERRKADHEAAQHIQRLMAQLAEQDARKNQILADLARKGDIDKEMLAGEAKRLNDKIEYITNEVTNNMRIKNEQLRAELDAKYQALEKLIKNEMNERDKHEQKIRGILDENWRSLHEELNVLSEDQIAEKEKIREKLKKINEALAVLESQQNSGTRKVDSVVSSEIKARKMNEKALLAKLTDVEDRLSTYLSAMSQTVEEVRKGSGAGGRTNVVVPALDFDAIRRDISLISADKHRMSLEGMLQLEDKMGRIERGLDRQGSELKDKINMLADDVDADTLARLRQQLRRLDEMQADIENAHGKLRDKVERQIPEDLDELNQKIEHTRTSMGERLDTEENERYYSVRELQEELSRLKAKLGNGVIGSDPNLEKEVHQNSLAIKKLSESITTVKNVLDRKLEAEHREREQALANFKGAAAGTGKNKKK